MDTLIHTFNILIGFYVFYECFTALNEMQKVPLHKILKELINPYALKYESLGLFALLVIYYSGEIKGWHCLLLTPSIVCVIGRTSYKLKRWLSTKKLQKYAIKSLSQ